MRTLLIYMISKKLNWSLGHFKLLLKPWFTEIDVIPESYDSLTSDEVSVVPHWGLSKAFLPHVVESVLSQFLFSCSWAHTSLFPAVDLWQLLSEPLRVAATFSSAFLPNPQTFPTTKDDFRDFMCSLCGFRARNKEPKFHSAWLFGLHHPYHIW